MNTHVRSSTEIGPAFFSYLGREGSRQTTSPNALSSFT